MFAGKTRVCDYICRADALIYMRAHLARNRKQAFTHDRRKRQDMQNRCKHISLPPRETISS